MLQDFRNGAFRLAKETNVPGTPIANAQERFSDVTMVVKLGNIIIHVFDPIDSKLFKDSFSLNYACHDLIHNKLKNTIYD